MKILDKLLGKESDALDEKFSEFAKKAVEKAQEQCRKERIGMQEEALKIGKWCDIVAKKQNPSAFVDVALFLLTYHPELAYKIMAELSIYKSSLNYDPVESVIAALGKLNSLYMEPAEKKNMMQKRPEIFYVLGSKNHRIQKAAQLLSVAILASRNIKEARNLYRNCNFDFEIKIAIDEELEKRDEEIKKAISE